VVHVINRGNDRRMLFGNAAQYEEFVDLMRHAASVAPVRLVGYALMPNHWHLVVWPHSVTQLSRYMQVLGTTHAVRWRRRLGQTGQGHVYQGRYHAFVIESERQFFNVLRYVESNPLRAGLVSRAADWRWCSLAERETTDRGLLGPSPLALPADWPEVVERAMPCQELADLREKTRRIQRAAWQPTRHPRRPREAQGRVHPPGSQK